MQGAELPLPKNAKENEELANLFAAQNLAQSGLGAPSTKKFAALWLRLDDSATEGTFVDSDTKAKVSYFNWYAGMPNNFKYPSSHKYAKIDQDYVLMYHNGQWNDFATYDKAHTVCQKKITLGK